ncbi:PRC-barrel domain-containing protein [Streptomyces sp. TP-A0356]|uniref:PRC-barrel domain-containing protein n=1 Tax=Streptomyces sp. TP-A0356 TaxID=1359208 RepID=UPI0006E1DC46|nr:PRC-barrel domain-containing protein [Streptomyces sp. TP-A0356]
MTSFSQARGLPVVTLGEAREIGVLSSLALDAAAGRITHVLVAGRGRGKTAVAWTALHAVGPDAVLVESDVLPDPGPPGPHHEALGSRVLSEDGDDRGAVQDILFDASTGRIEKVVTTLGEVPGDRLLGLGDYALVVRAD